MSKRIGVVLMSPGVPRTDAEISGYLGRLGNSQEPTTDQIDEVRARLDTDSDIAEQAASSQRDRLAAELDFLAEGRYTVVSANRSNAPFIEDAVNTLTGAADPKLFESVIGLSMEPHFSNFGVGADAERLAASLAPLGIDTTTVHHWYDLEEYIDLTADAVRHAMEEIGTPEASTKVLFTNRSAAEAVLVDDPFAAAVRDGANRIAKRAGLAPWTGWALATQGASTGNGASSGQPVNKVICDLAATGRADGVVVCPHGSLLDHPEVAHDLDDQARAAAEAVGLAFAQTRIPSDEPKLFAALAELVHAAAEVP